MTGREKGWSYSGKKGKKTISGDWNISRNSTRGQGKSGKMKGRGKRIKGSIKVSSVRVRGQGKKKKE